MLEPSPSVYRITMSKLSTWIVPRADKSKITPTNIDEKSNPIWTTVEDGCVSDTSSEANGVSLKG